MSIGTLPVHQKPRTRKLIFIMYVRNVFLSLAKYNLFFESFHLKFLFLKMKIIHYELA